MTHEKECYTTHNLISSPGVFHELLVGREIPPPNFFFPPPGPKVLRM